MFAGKVFVVIFICGTKFCRSLEKSQKLEPSKISCHMAFDLAFYLFLVIDYTMLRTYLCI